MAQAEARMDRGTILSLFAMGPAVLVIANDFTALSVSLTDIEKDLESDLTTVLFQIAGGSVGLGLNTAIVATADSLPEGIETAFRIDAALAAVGLVIAVLYVGGAVHADRLRALRWHHRAHA